MDEKQSAYAIYWPFVLLACGLAILVSGSVLKGDELGRVNILYLMLVYCVIPVLGLVLTLYSLARKSHLHMGYWLARSDLFPITRLSQFRQLSAKHMDHVWLLQQSQAMALGFSIGSLAVFFVLLLFTDIAFVWRSTILEPEQLHVWLNLMAAPWRFWDTAQPTLELLSQSRDYRLLNTVTEPADLASWWPFILAVQITYGILPRLMLWIGLSLHINVHSAEQSESDVFPEHSNPGMSARTLDVIPLSELTAFAGPWLFWDKVPETIIASLQSSRPAEIACNGWQGDEAQERALSSIDEVIVVVKAWEPPLAELGDYLDSRRGYLLPVHWQGDELKMPESTHWQEWQRFAAEHQWPVTQWEKTHG